MRSNPLQNEWSGSPGNGAHQGTWRCCRHRWHYFTQPGGHPTGSLSGMTLSRIFWASQGDCVHFRRKQWWLREHCKRGPWRTVIWHISAGKPHVAIFTWDLKTQGLELGAEGCFANLCLEGYLEQDQRSEPSPAGIVCSTSSILERTEKEQGRQRQEIWLKCE